MGKYEFIGLRRKLYELAGSLGTEAELNDNRLLDKAYDSISKSLDYLEEYGYDKNYIDRCTNEIVEDDDDI